MITEKIEIAAKPYALVANGIPTTFTFIPYNPEIIVGSSKMIVIAARNFMTWFKLLSMIDPNSDIVLRKILW